jgi:hypothetical protein
VQADGKILVGGDFTTLGGQPRNCNRSRLKRIILEELLFVVE